MWVTECGDFDYAENRLGLGLSDCWPFLLMGRITEYKAQIKPKIKNRLWLGLRLIYQKQKNQKAKIRKKSNFAQEFRD